MSPLSTIGSLAQIAKVTGLSKASVRAALAGHGGNTRVSAETVRRVLHGPGGWLVRVGEGLLALCALYGLWAIFAFGLASFSFHY